MNDELHIKIADTSYPIKIQKKKMKRMILKFRDGAFLLSAPLTLSDNEILTWVKKLRQEQVMRLIQTQKIKQSEDFVYVFGKKYALKIRYSEIEKVVIKAQQIVVYSKQPQKALEKYLQAQLLAFICERLEAYYHQDVISFMPTVTIQKMKSRYGVCFYQEKRLKFAYQLIHEPKAVIESVIVHELGHFYYHDHSQQFYDWVLYYCPAYHLSQQFLKQGGIGNDPINK